MTGSTATLRTSVRESTAQDPFRCYQCGNCSAGCPMSGHGDLLPHQIFRLLQMDRERPLHSVQPWLCVGCQTCAVRCPQELDLSRVMDHLRAEQVRQGTVPHAAKRMAAFNRIFLEQVLAGGRLSEVALGIRFNLAVRNPLENATALPGLMTRGKFQLPGRAIRGPGIAAKREGRAS